uniref:Uncharacterized protein n=1 Tax=Acrobeloides nanus TaxID=290746 RepID=A0A914C402_9BILA
MSAEKKKEGRLLIQAVFSGIPCIVIMTFHHLIRLPLVELLGAEWCLLNGPFVYLWFNSEIRSDFLELIRLKKATRKTYLNTFIQMRRQNTINDTYGMSGIGSEKGIWMGSGASEHAPPLPISDQKTSEGMNRDP